MLSNVLQDLLLPINLKKVESPSHKITCLGIQIDAKAGTFAIPEEKIQQLNICVINGSLNLKPLEINYKNWLVIFYICINVFLQPKCSQILFYLHYVMV